MAYDIQLADRVRAWLTDIPALKIEEKKMFGGTGFMVNGKMCVNISSDRLMCRFDPAQQGEVAEKNGYEPMIMKGMECKGFCYVQPQGFKAKKDFEYWMNLCVSFNEKARSSKKKKK